LKSSRGVQLGIISNGKPDSAIPGDDVTTIMSGLVPPLLAREPARAFLIGYGTGVTAGALAALDEMREVTVAEISPGVIEAGPLFDFGSLDASKNPKIRVVRGDAYRTLLRSQGAFDLIVSEPSNPWVTGVEMLFTREFLEAARDRLTPGGVHAQWFQIYEMDDETVTLAVRTYRTVFPHSSVWFTKGNDLLLIGVNDPEGALDVGRLQRRFERPDFQAGFQRIKITSFPAVLAHEILPLGVLTATELPGDLHTLLHPILSNRAARAFFVGGVGTLPVTAQPEPAEVGMRNSLVRRHANAHGGELTEDDRFRIVKEGCRHGTPQCAALMARWIVETPESPERDLMRRQIGNVPLLAQVDRLFAIDWLLGLYDDSPADTSEHVSPSEAARASELYAEYYHHAVPFSRRALAKLWQRCEEDPEQREACITARMNLKPKLGDLGP
jgi:hypothetical protein